MEFVEICNVCAKKAIIIVAMRNINSDKICRSYSDLNFGVTFFGAQCIMYTLYHVWLLSGLTRALLLVGTLVGVAVITVITTAACLLVKRRRRLHCKMSSFVGKELHQLETVSTVYYYLLLCFCN